MSGSGGANSPGITLGERDVYVGSIYNQVSVCILRHPATPTVAATLDVYTQNKYIVLFIVCL